MSYLPFDLMTSDVHNKRRLKVFNSDPVYDLGTQFRVSYELTVTNVAPVTLRFTSPIDFELAEQSIETHQSGIVFKAYRSPQGTETGVYDTPVNTYKNNFQSTANDYTGVVSIDTGGGFTPDVGQLPVEVINTLSASSTAQRASNFSEPQGKRGLAAGTYYLEFSKLGGSGAALGVYSLIFDEKP